MEMYVTEEQQVEAIKKWFRRYGHLFLWASLLLLFCIAILRYFAHHKTVVDEKASEHYFSLMNALAQQDELTLKHNAEVLLSQYSKTPYATFTHLILADHDLQNKQNESAIQHLQRVMEPVKQPYFSALARVRLMRVFFSQNQSAEALALFDESKAGPFLTLMLEIKGDILMREKNEEGAKQAYALALSAMPEEGMIGPLLKMKVEDSI